MKYKFRVWHKNKEKMIMSESISIWDRYCLSIDGNPIIESDGLNSYADWVEFNLYIGLKDINSIEIYENDIVKDRNGNIGVVEWNESVAAFSWSGGQDCGMIEVEHSGLFVIGNVYENKELWKS